MPHDPPVDMDTIQEQVQGVLDQHGGDNPQEDVQGFGIALIAQVQGEDTTYQLRPGVVTGKIVSWLLIEDNDAPGANSASGELATGLIPDIDVYGLKPGLFQIATITNNGPGPLYVAAGGSAGGEDGPVGASGWLQPGESVTISTQRMTRNTNAAIGLGGLVAAGAIERYAGESLF